jgi:hypothetical protein
MMYGDLGFIAISVGSFFLIWLLLYVHYRSENFYKGRMILTSFCVSVGMMILVQIMVYCVYLKVNV